METKQQRNRTRPNGGQAVSNAVRTQKNGAHGRKTVEGKSPPKKLVDGNLIVQKLCEWVYDTAPSASTWGNLCHWNTGGRADRPGINPSDYDDSAVFAVDYLGVMMLKKFDGFALFGEDYKKQAALVKWRQAEMQCFGTNCSWRSSGHLGHQTSVGTSGTVLNHARALIAFVLGDVTAETYEEIYESSDHGSGGTTRVKRSMATHSVKFSGVPEASTAICPWVEALKAEIGWPTVVKIVESSKMALVPKDSKIYRPISSEPDLNIFFQKGVGVVFKRRMARRAFLHKTRRDFSAYGLQKPTIDLCDQTPNQQYCRFASLSDPQGSASGNGGVATVDLSMASDCLSYEVVRALVPEDWFYVLTQFRTTSTNLVDEDKPTLLEKFSAMGNGFTFELESLIFWAICRALNDLGGSEHPVLVFGDDIIIDSRFALNGDLELMLAICGFTLNREKSYAEGPFRESCGKHYFRGDDVTPFLVRENVDNPESLMLLINNLRRWNCAWGTSGCRESGVANLRDLLTRFLPKSMRKISIPDGYGDGALIGTFEEIGPKNPWKLRPDHKLYGWEGWVCTTTEPVFITKETFKKGQLVNGLRQLSKKNRSYGRYDNGKVVIDIVPDTFGTVREGGKPIRVNYRQVSIACRRFPALDTV